MTGLPTVPQFFHEAEFEVTANGSNNISLAAVAAATTGSVYTGQIIADRI